MAERETMVGIGSIPSDMVGIGSIPSDADERYTLDDVVSWVKRDFDIRIFEDEVIEIPSSSPYIQLFLINIRKKKKAGYKQLLCCAYFRENIQSYISMKKIETAVKKMREQNEN